MNSGMDKQAVLAYLQRQLQRLDDADFDLDVWKNITAAFLNKAFGEGNPYASLILKLEYILKESHESLYVQKVPDMEKTRQKARSVLKAIMEQLELLHEAEFTPVADQKSALAARIREIFQDHLTGRQYRSIEEIVHSGDANLQKKIDEAVQELPVETVKAILTDLIGLKDIWSSAK